MLERHRCDGAVVYEERYRRGYMRAWPQSKQRRVSELLSEIPLPPAGCALDFGCGSGALSGVLRDILPRWDVWGTDVSTAALAQARARVSGVRFVPIDELEPGRGRFDLVFSHHVLEHVIDLDETIEMLAQMTACGGYALHVLPCGNPGSLEHDLARRARAIDPITGRFPYEDPSHERRLTTDALVRRASMHGFTFESAWYANQYAGALEWMTQSSPLHAWNMLRADIPLAVRVALMAALRFPARAARRFREGARRPVHYAALFTTVLYPVSRLLDRWLTRQAELEWRDRRHDPGGSEQYVLFRRGFEGES